MITPQAIRENFPALKNKCYLNTAAESIPPVAVGQALTQYWEDKQLGMDGRDCHFAREAEAKENAARLIGLSPEEVGFCSCASEAYNLLSTAIDLGAEDEVVVTDLDFPAGPTPWVGTNSPASARLWKSREGTLDLTDLAPLLSPKTRLVQVSLVSFYNGWRLPWQPFVSLVRELAPEAIVAVDLTQALGRCELDCEGADIVISSTHKWLLGIHGGCVVGVPSRSADRLTTVAGGWYHLRNAFDGDRFDRVDPKSGAASFSVGMPSFAPIYALNASMSYLLSVGVENIARHADPLVRAVHDGLSSRGVSPLAPLSGSGIVAFKHPDSQRINDALRAENVHIMHQAGRLRVALHGYNTGDDVSRFFEIFDSVLQPS